MAQSQARIGDRSLFPSLKPRVYTHHAAISPVSAPVQAAVGDALQRYAEEGAGAFPEFLAQRVLLRARLEVLIDAAPGSVALAANTTRGISDIALSIPWQSGDRVVLFKGEFPTNVTPWQQAAELFGLHLVWQDAHRFLQQQDAALEDLERELQRGVRLVAVSAVQFQSGLLMPLEIIGQLCERYGAELCVDAIQACGVVPMDVKRLRISYLACGGHKWLMGMEGCGFLYVEPTVARKLKPRVAGWLSHQQPEDFLMHADRLHYDKPLKQSALVFETGTLSVLGFVALHTGLGLILDLGVPQILEHVTRYLDALESELVARGFVSRRSPKKAARSGILSVVPPPGWEAAQWWGALISRGIVCGAPDGLLRFSPHWPNLLSEVAVIAQEIDAVLASR